MSLNRRGDASYRLRESISEYKYSILLNCIDRLSIQTDYYRIRLRLRQTPPLCERRDVTCVMVEVSVETMFRNPSCSYRRECQRATHILRECKQWLAEGWEDRSLISSVTTGDIDNPFYSALQNQSKPSVTRKATTTMDLSSTRANNPVENITQRRVTQTVRSSTLKNISTFAIACYVQVGKARLSELYALERMPSVIIVRRPVRLAIESVCERPRKRATFISHRRIPRVHPWEEVNRRT